ncbi:dihydroorotate dehydrogenase electron transfer subunit [Embleya sp. NBC_00896]|uniref:dihydroorotate dehydrogenase electron transfer subunit n=1 Tax=Embleya sp. NBC_00896 TaxID=2975961 RepID=UPI00386E2067|nr:dihydroorotate dehydrogenase electron transfer subunit [Embleya sp. NBC_00896]
MALPLQVQAEIVGREPAGAYHRMVLRAPGIAARVEPGHFVAVAIGGVDSSMLLRRAFSIHRADPEAETIDVVFSEAGRGTRELARLRPGDTVNVVAPLGTPFPLPAEPVSAVLVAGGYGSAPMFALAERVRDAGGSVAFVLGAATAERLYGVDQARAITEDVVVTTDDGSEGIRGFVTGPLPEVLTAVAADVVYACGPMGMLRAVTDVATAHDARVFTAVEESMACGVGVCMTCVLPVVGDDGVSRFVRSCVDGPCFDGTKVRWDDAGTIPADIEGAAAMGAH